MQEGLARVRVNIVSRANVEGNARDFVALEGVSLYGNADCHAIASTAQAKLAAVENDVGAMVAEAAVALSALTHVELRTAGTTGARRVRAQRIALPQPLVLEPGTRTEVFLALEPVEGSQELAARYVAGGPVALDATTVLVYEPGRGAAVVGPGNFTLDLAPGSLAAAGVYGIVEHRLGDVSSLFSIAPAAALTSAARVTFPVDAARIPGGMTMDDYRGYAGSQRGLGSVSNRTMTLDVASLGDIALRASVAYVELPDGTRQRIPAASASASDGRAMLVNNQCSANLSANRAYFFDLLSRNAGVKITSCESVSPYVHILLVNLRYATPASYPLLTIPATRYTDGTFLLKTLSEHATNVGAFGAINGFTWSGDEGTGTYQYGTPIGTLRMYNATVSPYYSGAEAIIGFTSSSSTGGTYSAFFDKAAGNSISWGSYGYWAVPSTTSIVKGGVCSRTPGGEDNRWSAIGVGNGALVMASSTSGSSTTAYELCSVFEGLNVMGGAIRLDGGPSAAIYWNGSGTSTGVLNPLTGLASYKYGSLRRIPYALAAYQ